MAAHRPAWAPHGGGSPGSPKGSEMQSASIPSSITGSGSLRRAIGGRRRGAMPRCVLCMLSSPRRSIPAALPATAGPAERSLSAAHLPLLCWGTAPLTSPQPHTRSCCTEDEPSRDAQGNSCPQQAPGQLQHSHCNTIPYANASSSPGLPAPQKTPEGNRSPQDHTSTMELGGLPRLHPPFLQPEMAGQPLQDATPRRKPRSHSPSRWL